LSGLRRIASDFGFCTYLTELLWLAATNQFFASRPYVVVGLFFCLGLAAFGPTMLGVFFVNIRCCGDGLLRFRPYGDSLFFKRQKK
jgi:hypothetical protein